MGAAHVVLSGQFQFGVTSFKRNSYPFFLAVFLYNKVEEYKITFSVIASDSGSEKPRSKIWVKADSCDHSWAVTKTCRTRKLRHSKPVRNTSVWSHPFTHFYVYIWNRLFNQKTNKTFPREPVSENPLKKPETRVYSIKLRFQKYCSYVQWQPGIVSPGASDNVLWITAGRGASKETEKAAQARA